MSGPQRAALHQALSAFCIDPVAVADRGALTRSDLRLDAIHGTEAQLREALASSVRAADPELLPFIPRVDIRRENREAWRSWWSRWGRKLKTWATESNATFDEARFLRRVEPQFEALRFEPATASGALLQPPVADLEAVLAAFSPAFRTVSSAPEANRWTSARGSFGRGGAGPEQKFVHDDASDDAIARELYGEEAEAAFLAWVVDQTRRLLDLDGARDVLLSALPDASETRQRVATALDAGNLSVALQISEHWSGAGYDILGLEPAENDAGVGVVRYECKGLPATADRVRVHLSRNQLALARNVNANGPGRWALVGIEPNGDASDLTGRLGPVLDDAAAGLRQLIDAGIEPDGIRLVLERLSGVSAVVPPPNAAP